MNRKIGITLAVVAVLIGTMLLIPILFKGKIIDKIKSEANQSVNAKIDFGKVDLSLLRSFPKLSIQITNFEISGINQFEGQKLATVKSLAMTTNLSSLWNSGKMEINKIVIHQPEIVLISDSLGNVNWDIAKENMQETAESSNKSIQIDLEKIELNKASLVYLDKEAPMQFSLRNGNFVLSGNMKGSNSELNIKGAADSICFDYGKNNFVNNITAQWEGGLQANFDKMAFKFLDNQLSVNQLPVKADGTFVLGNDNYDFDIQFQSPSSTFGDLLGLIPPQYQSYLKEVQTSGNISFSGFVKGIYSEATLPAFSIDLKVDNGRLKYPSLPKEVENINIQASLSKPQGNIDSTTVSIGQFNANIAGNPLQAKLLIKNPASDPLLKGNLNGRIDFTSVKQAIPLDSFDIKGIIDAKLAFDGRYSAIEKEQYEQFRTDGTISMKGFQFQSKDLPQSINIATAELKLNPKSIQLSRLEGKIGESDFTASGALSQYWQYLMNRGELNGILKVTSNYLNLNQFITSQTTTGDTTIVSKPFKVPQNLNLQLQAVANKILYEKMNITGASGLIWVKEQKIILDNLNMNLLNGKMVVSGSYATPNQSEPDFDFKLGIKDFDLPSAAKSLNTVAHFIPVASESSGAFGSDLVLKGKIGDNYIPVFNSLNGIGSISAFNVEIIGSPAFQEIAKYFRKEVFSKVKVSDFTAKINISEGGIDIAPFTTKIAGQEVTVSGRQTASLDLNYRLNFNVNKRDLSDEVNKLIGIVPGSENIQMLPIGIDLRGNASKPEVKIDLDDARKVVEAEFKKKAKSEIQNAIKKLGLDKLIK